MCGGYPLLSLTPLISRPSGAVDGAEPALGPVAPASSQRLGSPREEFPRCGAEDTMWVLEDLLGQEQLRRQGSSVDNWPTDK